MPDVDCACAVRGLEPQDWNDHSVEATKLFIISHHMEETEAGLQRPISMRNTARIHIIYTLIKLAHGKKLQNKVCSPTATELPVIRQVARHIIRRLYKRCVYEGNVLLQIYAVIYFIDYTVLKLHLLVMGISFYFNFSTLQHREFLPF